MFQKLYKHLEEVNSNLRRQEVAVGASSTYEKEILQQLEMLNESIRLGRQDFGVAVKKPNGAYPIALLVLAFVSIGIIVFLNLRLSGITRDFVNTREKDSRQLEWQAENMRDRQSEHGRQRDVAAQLTKLDSIIGQQSQAVEELKDLNKISVRTFMRLKSRMDQTDRQILSMKSDSGHYIGRAR